jgi:hypothetical protein
MLRFDVYNDGAPAGDVDLSGAYVFGQDQIPVRADLAVSNGQISCVKRVPGAAGLTIMWDATSAGKFLLSTTRLPERNKPYNLNLELCRSQMMHISQKIEDWGLFDYPDAQGICQEFDQVRMGFIEALKTPEPAKSAATADAALAAAITLGEKIALFHADIFLNRRRNSGASVLKYGFGCVVDLFSVSAAYQDLLRDSQDFLSLPVPWKHTEPKERLYKYTQNDTWIQWATKCRKPLHVGPLVSFEPTFLPEWLYLWEHDYETLRDLIYEHIQRIVHRYEKQVRVWNVVSGIHAYNNFNLSFEQLMELTRMSCLLVKKLAPRSIVMIELAMPWGEYYSRNQRTIPPLLYADMAVQSGIKFDAFGVQMFMGAPVDGCFVRDLLQVSTLLDEFVSMGKPLHITGCQVPSDITPDAWDAWGGKAPPPKAGHWHAPWSQRLQAEWLQAFYRIAISKPYVESITWRDLADYEGHYIPHGGLCKNNLEAKLSYKELRNFRALLASKQPVTDPQKRIDISKKEP